MAFMRREGFHVVDLWGILVRFHAQEVGTLTHCQLLYVILPGIANPYLYLHIRFLPEHCVNTN